MIADGGSGGSGPVGFFATNGTSTVTTSAPAPAAAARSATSSDTPRSRSTYICCHHGPAAAAMSSRLRLARIDSTSSDPASRVPIAVATSPSACARPCSADGATSTGAATSVPSTVVRVVTAETSRSSRGRRCSASHARSCSASVRSAPEPAA